MARIRLVAALAVLLTGAPPVLAQAQMIDTLHPLDHLTPDEHWAVYHILRASGRTDSTMVIAYVALHEPPKAEVLAWRAGQDFRREAFVRLIQGGAGYEAVLDLKGRRVLEWSDTPGQNYMWDSGDDKTVSQLMLGHPEIRAGLERRGVTDFTHIECWGANEGYFDQPEERGNRVVRASCSEGRGRFTSFGRIFEGLVGVVDLTNKRVLRVIDGDPIRLGNVTEGPAWRGRTYQP